MATNTSTPDPCQTPLAPNSHPNFDHHASFQPITIGVGTVLLTVAVVFLGLRIAATLRKKGRLFLDDYFCIVALLLSALCLVLEIASRKNYGHAQDMNSCQTDKESRQRLEIVAFLAYYLAMLSVKVAVCTIYLRLFAKIPWIVYATWTIMILYSITCITGFFVGLAMYISDHWSNVIENGIDIRPYVLAHIAFTILTDLALLIIPIQPIMHLNLTLRKRIGILSAFFAMAGATACTAVLLAIKVEYYYTTFNDPDYDWTWMLCIMKLITSIEMLMNIILCCVPGVVSAWRNLIRDTPFVTKLGSLFSSKQDKSSRAQGSRTIKVEVLTSESKEARGGSGSYGSRLSVIKEEIGHYGEHGVV